MTLSPDTAALIRGSIRTIADYPKAGIQFRDITTLLSNPAAYKASVDALISTFEAQGITKVVGIEARGFIIGGAVAYGLGAGFVPMRKRGKLPYDTIGKEYELEYGTDKLELHIDAVSAGDKILLIDDLIATGGTAMAAIDLIELGGARVTDAAFLVDLPDLGGAARIKDRGVAVEALIAFEGE